MFSPNSSNGPGIAARVLEIQIHRVLPNLLPVQYQRSPELHKSGPTHRGLPELWRGSAPRRGGRYARVLVLRLRALGCRLMSVAAEGPELQVAKWSTFAGSAYVIARGLGNRDEAIRDQNSITGPASASESRRSFD